MTTRPPEWFDAQYNNRARVPEHPAILRDWSESSARTYADHRAVLDVPYGDDPSERVDIFPTTQPHAPVLVYVHGGYWRALDKRDQSFVAPPFVASGAMVVLANYALCPAVSVEHIARQMVRLLAWLYRHVADHGGDPARIVVAGHSAGGHLAAMLLAQDWPAHAPDLPPDLVKGALSISGIYDLEPLRHAPFLAPDLNLTEASARLLSPAHLPAPRGVLVSVVGGDESEEFLRQADLIVEAWGPGTVQAAEVVPGRNHMSVLREISDPASLTHRWALRLMGLTPG